ncbi:MAG: HEAT repeat domain-containing protein [Acidobacteria bacterium]|nr:HEAT repeat domain-containing protein [Acidobacteriota bacterium]MDA1236009.1 HEAT repeat domain-containing protein [Acidobacteriota bacterium]
MTEDIRNKVSLYLYGELSAEDETQFEEELGRSATMAAAVEQERQLIETLRQRAAIDFGTADLADCRMDLMRAIRQESVISQKQSWLSRLRTFFNPNTPNFAWQGALALVLVAAGFWGGRATQQFRMAFFDQQPIAERGSIPIEGAALASYEDIPDVRSISTGPGSSSVEIVVEERRTIRGNANDPQIQALLIAMSRSSNSGRRLDMIDLLRQRTDDPQVRGALVKAMLEDENAGARLKALDALAPYKQDVDVRHALITTLRTDANPGMRVYAIDLLTANPDRELVEVLQDVVRYEPNSWVRLRSEQTLAELNASIGLY